MAICENCGRTYDSEDGVDNPFHNFCSKICEDDFSMRFNDEKVEHPSRYNK